MIVIFDLDGTLLNTIADLAAACNHALQVLGYPTHPLEEYPRMVGNGINRLLERALPPAAKTTPQQIEHEVLRLRAEFIPYYNQHSCDLTTPYEGIVDLLSSLRAKGIKLAVASNKYQSAAVSIVQSFFPDTFDYILGERENIPRKPHPQIVYDILSQLTDNHVLYVGDSLVDIETARNAHIPVAACSWGFCSRQDLQTAKPDYLIDKPAQLLNLLSI